MAEYRVNLEMYNGPLDLLLYLIRRDEVDIQDIPIVRITEQYLQHVDMLQALDPNLAGEFLVMAATLIEIKSRMLLPPTEVPPEESEEWTIDPRADLVRQLLQYKAFKDAAGRLQLAAELQALKFPRCPGGLLFDGEKDVDLEEVQVWDLLEVFRNVMEAIGRRPASHEVIYDDTPVELHAEDILDRLRREGPMVLERIFEGRTRRSEVIGLFLAILELIRLQKIFIVPGEAPGRIDVHLNPHPPAEREVEHLFARATLSDEEPPAEASDEADTFPPYLPDLSGGEQADEAEEEDDDLSLAGLLADELPEIDLGGTLPSATGESFDDQDNPSESVLGRYESETGKDSADADGLSREDEQDNF